METLVVETRQRNGNRAIRLGDDRDLRTPQAGQNPLLPVESGFPFLPSFIIKQGSSFVTMRFPERC
jgi:hypothetical protein